MGEISASRLFYYKKIEEQLNYLTRCDRNAKVFEVLDCSIFSSFTWLIAREDKSLYSTAAVVRVTLNIRIFFNHLKLISQTCSNSYIVPPRHIYESQKKELVVFVMGMKVVLCRLGR